MNAVAYIWRGLINCFYLFVILYVFDNIQDKNTSIIIAVLALLYTTMRTIAGGQALTVLAMGRGAALGVCRSKSQNGSRASAHLRRRRVGYYESEGQDLDRLSGPLNHKPGGSPGSIYQAAA